MTEHPKPRQSIRRFDVFAEFNKQKQMQEGYPLDEAKGYGLWLAKVVASRRFRPTSERKSNGEQGPTNKGDSRRPSETKPERFRTLNEEAQTDSLFDQEIIRRMGSDFYRDVFAPAIADAVERGQKYEAIRDSIRKNWKAVPSE